MEAHTSEVTQGTVTRIVDYGAIVQLTDGRTGLLHISEIADAFVRSVRDYVAEGDSVKVMVLGRNERGRLELSARKISPLPMKAAAPPAEPTREHNGSEGPRCPRGPESFEQKLHRFMKQSEERLSDLKRNTEAKRGGPHRR